MAITCKDSSATPWMVLLSIALGTSLAPMDSSVNAAFPAITQAFALAVTDIRWVIIVYVLTYASLPLALGRTSDLFGHRRLFLIGIGCCALAYIACAMATQFHWLLLARAWQGVGTALILATAPALVTLNMPAPQRTRALALYTAAFATSQTIGPLLGGVLMQFFGWAAVFWMRIPIAILAIVLTLRYVPKQAVREHRGTFNPLSGIMFSFGLAACLLAIAQGGHFGWRSPTTLSLAVVGIILLWQFTRRQQQPEQKIIDFTHFKDRPFAVANVCNILINASFFMVMLLVPYYLHRQYGGYGVMLLALAPLGFACGSPIAARLINAHGAHRPSVLALLLCALSLGAIVFWPQADASATITPIGSLFVAGVLLLCGVGYGLFQVAVLDQMMSQLPRSDQGVAGSLITVTRTIGVVLGASAGSAWFDAQLGFGFDAAFSSVFQGACALALCTTIVMYSMGRRE